MKSRTMITFTCTLALVLSVACGGSEADISGGGLVARYVEAGERLYAERSSSVAWEDGSNWTDGVSHQLPDLSMDPDDFITKGMTCAQWEALEMAVFPEGGGYNRSNWWSHSDSAEIKAKWNRNLASAVWDDENMTRRLAGPVFMLHCGETMQ